MDSCAVTAHHDLSSFGSEQKQWAHLITTQFKNGNL